MSSHPQASYSAPVLPAKTRLRVSIALTAFAGLGLLVSDQLEKVFPPDATKDAAKKPPSS